ncbi:DUF3800 domain-containing protein [Pontiella agarivorans]|uniref:DUF3800 domain-containing protein n=1 Tax=Pontiella agarivorans TaxID=3038953 RepID=A0ABU5MVK4_9BACT|nr:DUF3800 domain-containing protein [Pontiella agarivorans]MDZ8118200.1 DUF3800 domain-containing protein [Pontiella agarivorans]
MRNVGGTSEYIAFLDECGDHTLELIDRDFPLFLLATIVIKRTDYAERVVPEITRLKLKYWIHEGVNLHSRDIRKSKGPFGFLRVAGKRQAFMTELSELMKDLPYTVFISAVRKDHHRSRYGANAVNPYDLALKFTLERLIHFIEDKRIQELPFVAEARGKNEDQALERSFYRMMVNGTDFIRGERFKVLDCPLVFRRKFDNIAGVQLADLCAHPCARHILQPAQENRAYDIVTRKVYRNGGISGWKVFP